MQTAERANPGPSGTRTSPASSGPPEGLRCPHCRSAVDLDGASAPCRHCGRAAVIQGGRIVDFLAGNDPVAEAILAWPDAFVQQVEPRLLELAAGKPVGPDAVAELRDRQLLAPEVRLTPLGSNLAYHCTEFAVQ